jgi:predicted MPP superfamily phosphohydrolase
MFRRLIFASMLVGLAVALHGLANAMVDPIRREAVVEVVDWPGGQASLRIALMSDIHVAGPDMPPARLQRIVAQLNEEQADIILLAGDLVSDKLPSTRRYSAADAVAPLAALEAPLGVFAVLGNHDHWRDADAVRAALGANGITLLENGAAQAGLLTVIGVDDAYTGRADVARAFAAAESMAGPAIVLSHSPDIVPDLPLRVALAGHTHCGQISLPWIGRLATASRYGDRFACGLLVDNGQTVVVGAGVGTSILPVRFGVPPDYWIIELRSAD